jgi:trans-aconitate methyltransferase
MTTMVRRDGRAGARRRTPARYAAPRPRKREDRPTGSTTDRWTSGEAYERYVGRWSRRIAADFLEWLAIPAGRTWLDVGSGTGALTEAILARCEPTSITGIDTSQGFVEHARAAVTDGRASFAVGAAAATGLPDASIDVAVAGLVLNFVPDVPAAMHELRRVLVPGGVVASYVWDYAEGMEFMRVFWDAAVAVDPGVAELDQGRRFPIAAPGPLAAAFTDAGLVDVAVRPIVIPTVFADFDDYWQPFLGGTGSAPTYVASLAEPDRAVLRDRLRTSLVAEPDGSIRLAARAWAVRGRRPG